MIMTQNMISGVCQMKQVKWMIHIHLMKYLISTENQSDYDDDEGNIATTSTSETFVPNINTQM